MTTTTVPMMKRLTAEEWRNAYELLTDDVHQGFHAASRDLDDFMEAWDDNHTNFARALRDGRLAVDHLRVDEEARERVAEVVGLPEIERKLLGLVHRMLDDFGLSVADLFGEATPEVSE